VLNRKIAGRNFGGNVLQIRRPMTLTGAGLFTLLFAEAVRAPRVGMIVGGRGPYAGRIRDTAVCVGADQGRSTARACSDQHKAYRDPS